MEILTGGAVAHVRDARVPLDRRTFYALLILTGARVGEISALKWGDYDPHAPGLGRITLAVSYNRRTKQVERTKTGAIKFVPVHPALRAALAAWTAHQGRDTKPEELIVPSKLGRPRSPHSINEA